MLPETAFLTGPRETPGDICVAQEEGSISQVGLLSSFMVLGREGPQRGGKEECGPAHQDRARPSVLSTALRATQGTGTRASAEKPALPQLTCCVILAGREGAPQTPRTFPSEHRSSLRAIGTGLVQKAQHLAWLFFFKPATKRGFCKLSYALDTP